STPAIRAISCSFEVLVAECRLQICPNRQSAIQQSAISYPCLCLCFWFGQITRTTPRRRTILHLSQIRLTEALTFIAYPVHVSPRSPQRSQKKNVLCDLGVLGG